MPEEQPLLLIFNSATLLESMSLESNRNANAETPKLNSFCVIFLRLVKSKISVRLNSVESLLIMV